MRISVNYLRVVWLPLIVVAILVAPAICVGPVRAAVVDPLANGPVDPDLFTNGPVVQTAATPKPSPRQDVRMANFEDLNQPANPNQEVQPLPVPPGAAAEPKSPCAAIESRPLNQLGINIAHPTGNLPTDLAAPCWTDINQGDTGAPRCWTTYAYNWDATCFYHNPLYFEEANLERYGYQCGDRCCCATCGKECCLQPAA